MVVYIEKYDHYNLNYKKKKKINNPLLAFDNYLSWSIILFRVSTNANRSNLSLFILELKTEREIDLLFNL